MSRVASFLVQSPAGDNGVLRTHLATLASGKSYFRALGVEHNVVNASAHEVVFVEVEVR